MAVSEISSNSPPPTCGRWNSGPDATSERPTNREKQWAGPVDERRGAQPVETENDDLKDLLKDLFG